MTFHVLADSFSHGQYMLQISTAIFVRWRPDGNELQLAVSHRLAGACAKTKPLCSHILFNKTLKTWLVNRNFATAKSLYFLLIDIYTDDVVTNLCQYRALNQTDIAAPKNRHLHMVSLSLYQGITTARPSPTS